MLDYSNTFIVMHLVVIINGRYCGNINRHYTPPLTDNPDGHYPPRESENPNCRPKTTPPIVYTNTPDCNPRTTQPLPDEINPDCNPRVTKPLPKKRRKNCCPYDFDSRLCREINGRILCGYDRNIGRPGVSDYDRDLGRGCRLRNGRLECGYVQPPFTPDWRPPAWDGVPWHQVNNGNTVPIPNNYETPDVMPPNNINDDRQKQLKMSTDLKMFVTKCVEISNRVVCKPVGIN